MINSGAGEITNASPPPVSASFLKELEKLRDYKVVHTLVPAIIWSEKIARKKSKKF